MGDIPDYSVQPRPRQVDGAVSAHDLVIEDLLREFPGDTAAELAIDAMRDRKAYGLDKYGVVLHKDNGRDYVKDVDDEVGDLVAYLRVYMHKHPDLVPIFAEDYLAILRFLIRWRVAVPALQELDAR